MQHEAPALRLFRGLLWLYPSEFRDHFSREICFAFADRLREQPTLACILSMYWGVLSEAPKEHYHVIRQDITYTLRTMRREKVATLTAVLVLALGIGSTTTIFTLANGLLLRPLPYAHQETLVTVGELPPGAERPNAVAFPNFLDMRARNRTLENFALFTPGPLTLRGDMEAERVPGATVTASAFPALGVAPLLGHWFAPEDDQPNAPPTVILGEGLWRRRYGADMAIVGKSIIVGSTPARVTGVMPQAFHFPDVAEMWVPLRSDPKTNKRTDYFLRGMARLAPGISIPQAESDLNAVMEQIKRENPRETFEQSVKVEPFRLRTTASLQPLLFTLLAAVGFVLLIACANITNLLLVKASARSREIAVRGAMGATRMRIIRQFLAESLILGLAGAVCGSALAAAAVPGMMRLTPPDFLPSWVAFSPDLRILGFVVTVTMAASLLAGAAPAISSSRHNLVDALKEGARSSTPGSGKARLRSGLVVAEVAMSILLLAGAGLMIRTFFNLERQRTGFQPENLTTLVASVPGNRYPGGEPAQQLVRRIRQELAALPGVVAVAGASGVPILDGWGRSLTAEGHPVLSLKDAPIIRHTVVTPGYFQTIGLPILEGRDFTEQDAKDSLVTIVDAAIARRYWPNQSAVGKRVRYGPPEYNEPWHTIVGVVDEVRNQSLRATGQSQRIPAVSRVLVVNQFVSGAHPRGNGRSRRRHPRTHGGDRPGYCGQPHADHGRDPEPLGLEGAILCHPAGVFRRSRAAVGGSRLVRRDGLHREPPDARDGHTHGDGSVQRRDSADDSARERTPDCGRSGAGAAWSGGRDAIPRDAALRGQPYRCADAAGRGCRPGGRRNGGELPSRPTRYSRGSHDRVAGGLGL